MLTKPQRDHITSSWNQFVEDFDPVKIRELFFRLDDLMQYGSEAVSIAYLTVSNHLKKEKD